MVQPQDKSNRSLFGRMASGASDRVLDIVDPNQILDHVDVDALLDRVDVDALLDRVDVNQLLDRVDVNRLMDRVDVDAILDRVDVQELVDRAGIPEIVAESTSHLTGSALDLFRRPIVGLDEIAVRIMNRLIGRSIDEYPDGPSDLLEWVDERSDGGAQGKTGNFAGPFSRLFAFLLDSFVVTAGFTAIVAAIVFTLSFFVDGGLTREQGFFYLGGFVVWAFLYQWVSYAVFGKTIGKMVLGLRVAAISGDLTLRGKTALVRVLTYPLSFILFGVGLLGIVFNPRRQAWHDRFAKTAVVYDWGTITSAMPTPLAEYLERRGEDV